ncbi:hypothetical protein ACFYZB_27905 [Streptomyces sp. NPDC001852]|uniref:hypothetical protein n=1 Tax=Streptomyces sp. NPDC001852 TaxID=3364619 RepID=UPI00367720ED
MEQPTAQFNADPHEPAPAAGAGVWESDLADVAALPLTFVEGLAPLPPDARLLKEVLRARGGMRGGGEGGGAARAE